MRSHAGGDGRRSFRDLKGMSGARISFSRKPEVIEDDSEEEITEACMDCRREDRGSPGRR